jgi:hypothetical protein
MTRLLVLFQNKASINKKIVAFLFVASKTQVKQFRVEQIISQELSPIILDNL